MRPYRSLLVALFLVLMCARAEATAIEITSGFIVAGNDVPASPMALGGDPVTGQGLTFVGSWGYNVSGGLGLWTNPGLPGETRNNFLQSGPDSVFGTATLNGNIYHNVGLNTAGPVPPYLQFFLNISSSFVYPALGATGIVVTPFTLIGSVQYLDAPSVAGSIDLVGAGLSTITLRLCSDCGPVPGQEHWDWVSV